MKIKNKETTRINYYEDKNVYDYIVKNNKAKTIWVKKATKALMEKELRAK